MIEDGEEDARQFPERPHNGSGRGAPGPAETPVDPAVPDDDNERADDRVEIVKEPPARP